MNIQSDYMPLLYCTDDRFPKDPLPLARATAENNTTELHALKEARNFQSVLKAGNAHQSRT